MRQWHVTRVSSHLSSGAVGGDVAVVEQADAFTVAGGTDSSLLRLLEVGQEGFAIGVLVGVPVPLLVSRGDSRVVQVAAPPAGGYGYLALRVPLHPAELDGVPSVCLRRRAPPGARRRTRTARALGAEHGAREVERRW